jgi:hypothetical protein
MTSTSCCPSPCFCAAATGSCRRHVAPLSIRLCSPDMLPVARWRCTSAEGKRQQRRCISKTIVSKTIVSTTNNGPRPTTHDEPKLMVDIHFCSCLPVFPSSRQYGLFKHSRRHHQLAPTWTVDTYLPDWIGPVGYKYNGRPSGGGSPQVQSAFLRAIYPPAIAVFFLTANNISASLRRRFAGLLLSAFSAPANLVLNVHHERRACITFNSLLDAVPNQAEYLFRGRGRVRLPSSRKIVRSWTRPRTPPPMINTQCTCRGYRSTSCALAGVMLMMHRGMVALRKGCDEIPVPNPWSYSNLKTSLYWTTPNATICPAAFRAQD